MSLVAGRQTKPKRRILLAFLPNSHRGTELPLTGCNEVIYLPDLVLGVFGTHSRSADRSLSPPALDHPRRL
jgi:hypothetical protein